MVKFLIIRFESEAEILLAGKVAECLSGEVEDSEVHFLTSVSHAGVLEGNPRVKKVHTDENMRALLRKLREESFDYIIDLQNNLQSARIKLSLKRMDFTLKRPARGKEQDLEERFMETIRLFRED